MSTKQSEFRQLPLKEWGSHGHFTAGDFTAVVFADTTERKIADGGQWCQVETTMEINTNFLSWLQTNHVSVGNRTQRPEWHRARCFLSIFGIDFSVFWKRFTGTCLESRRKMHSYLALRLSSCKLENFNSYPFINCPRIRPTMSEGNWKIDLWAFLPVALFR